MHADTHTAVGIQVIWNCLWPYINMQTDSKSERKDERGERRGEIWRDTACSDLFFCLHCSWTVFSCNSFYIIPPIVIKHVLGQHIGLVNYPIWSIAHTLTAQCFCFNNAATMNMLTALLSGNNNKKSLNWKSNSSGCLACEQPGLSDYLPFGRKSFYASTASPTNMSIVCTPPDPTVPRRTFISICVASLRSAII